VQRAHRADGGVAVDGAAAVLGDLSGGEVAAGAGLHEGVDDALVPLRLLLVAARRAEVSTR